MADLGPFFWSRGWHFYAESFSHVRQEDAKNSKFFHVNQFGFLGKFFGVCLHLHAEILSKRSQYSIAQSLRCILKSSALSNVSPHSKRQNQRMAPPCRCHSEEKGCAIFIAICRFCHSSYFRQFTDLGRKYGRSWKFLPILTLTDLKLFRTFSKFAFGCFQE